MEKKKLTLKEIGISKLVIILLMGIFLIVLSFPNLFSGNKKETVENKSSVLGLGEKGNSITISDSNLKYAKEMETQLQEILRKVEGVGVVEVMITLESTRERVTLKDNPYSQESVSETDSSGGSRVSSNVSKEEKSVLVDNQEGSSVPYIIKETMPKIEGVVVIAKGGGNITIIQEIMDATMVLFDVPVHKIKVMKME